MPLYEYECEDGHKFESVKPIPERHTAVCKCGKLFVKFKHIIVNIYYCFVVKICSDIIISLDF